MNDKTNKRLPTSVCLGPHTIKVRFVDMRHTDAYGIFDERKLEILIDRTISGSLAWETYVHEVFEAVTYYAELGLDHSKIQTAALLLAQAFPMPEK